MAGIDLWAQVYNGLAKRFPVLATTDSSQFQFAPTSMRASWWDNTPSNVAAIADSAPLSLGYFYTASTSKISESFGLFLNSLEGNGPGLEEARKAYNDLQNWHDVVLEGGGGTERIPNLSMNPDLNQQLATWRSRSSAVADIVWDDMVGANTVKKSTWSVERPETDIQAFVRFSAETATTGGPRFEKGGDPDQCELRLAFKALEAFEIRRGDWWLGSLLRSYQAGPFLKPYTESLFFGDSGILKLIPAQVFVSYQPAATLVVSTDYYRQNQEAFSSPAGVELGPWVLGGAAGSVEVEEAKGTATIALSTRDDDPYVVGILSEKHRMISGFISVRNSGAFVATFWVQYVHSGDTRTEESGEFPVLVTKTLQLPADATDILVTVKIATIIETWTVVATYRYDTPVTKSFELTGATWHPKCSEV